MRLTTRGNPMRYTDPSGHCVTFVGGLVADVVSGGAALVLSPVELGIDAACWAAVTEAVSLLVSTFGPQLPAVADPNIVYLADQAANHSAQQGTGQQNAGNPGDPGGLDPNNFDPDKGKTVVRSLQQLFNRYPLDSGNCSTCATKTYDVLKNAGYNAEIVRFEYGKNIVANAMLKANGEVIATSRGATAAYHEFVRVGDRVFDAMTGPAGMNWNDYLKLWDPDTLRLVTQVVVQGSQK